VREADGSEHPLYPNEEDESSRRVAL